MKIAYLFSRYPVPSQTFCDTEMRALERRGFHIEIYSCSPPVTSFRHDAAERPRGPVFYAPPQAGLELARQAAIARGRWPEAVIAGHEARFGTRFDPRRRAMHAVAFSNQLGRRGVSHIHVHFANRATHAALFIHALTGIPFSFTAHGQDFLVDLDSDALLEEMCAQASFVATVSDFSRAALLEKCPAAGAKIHRIYNGLPLELWPDPAPRAEVAPGHLRIFSAGRLIGFKGFDDLIAACAELGRRGVAFSCEIAGDGPERASLQSQIAAAGLGDRVHLAGLLPQAEIRAQLAACDVFALASRPDEKRASDVLPTVILEAMAAGVPVVSTRLAGIPEMVVDGRTGLLAEPGDTAAIAGALARFAAEPMLRASFGRAGRARFEHCFSSGEAAGRLASLFAGSADGDQSSKQVPAPCVRDREEIAPVSGLVLLLDAWPVKGDAAISLAALIENSPDMRVLALRAAHSPQPPGNEVLSLMDRIAFLPDAIVLEAEWRERAQEAHGMEACRGRIGTGVDTADFLQAARRALFLHHRWMGEPRVTHVHAAGPAALLCAWLLIQLDPTRQASFLLPSANSDASIEVLPRPALRRVASAFIGGWLPGAPRLVAELGEAFYGGDLQPRNPGWHAWQNAIRGWASNA